MFNELKWRSIVMCFASLIAVDDASAGPSTYNECVLDEMKGRPQYMIETVRNDCTAKFCTWVPPTEAQIDESNIKYNRCLAESDQLVCLMGRNIGHYDYK